MNNLINLVIIRGIESISTYELTNFFLIRFGKRAPMRFGKRAPMRFGKRDENEDLSDMDFQAFSQNEYKPMWD